VNGLLAGKTHVVERTTNFVNWISTATNVAAGSTITCTNNVSRPRSFYRVVQLP
jgi:hypothetical protein